MSIVELLKMAHRNKASDVHITVGVPPVIRVNGKLIHVDNVDNLMPEDTEKIAYELLTEKQIAVLKDKGEIDFSYAISGVGRFRVNVYSQRGSYSVAIRPIPLDIPSAQELGLPDILTQLADRKRGLILVTGPTGSGKSTTLATMIDHINETRRCHVLTLEDPIEYLHRHKSSIINQREIGYDTGSYNTALRAALRQDPDVILIGEMRDLETISIAVTAAETGHLVLATLHTIGAVSTVDRVIDVFPAEQQQQVRVQLGSVLQGVISQQLVRRADGSGRIGAFEIMICNQAVRNLIREGKSHQLMSSIQTGRKIGMMSMDTSLVELYKKGYITVDEAMAHSVDKTFIKRLL
ncbi:type IV pilus twitching motility protein PilT [Acidaminobacter sp. JC074]|uniref:type IV pilus twitching motility protein PilT n=1 Tax=Acidaminobacter sp. JC074 TaxID=2530199 RepID=UPI001F0F2DC6|nr:type IV pilus twitching motility protein PilT [Acidaminobacter sp. JC074]MCH4888797.1 type IV pilus twitching motility protein PilT [Acidaminobacter sp. JC074]